ncbi:hypothetical protein CKALI_11460 [Corynebacterium kalinowskii]|uniref:Uncharacterized protein n=1 Tax=Corynebacterium kalinowskii TaxID=2675216 RepID=A0A6B8VWQ1_9CORY|nr:hypothetical protein [Corynebacterium kalinowskii]QGU03136.1 hypothetical protein CKALI_11460 [Corynebacterium kalinowskii]
MRIQIENVVIDGDENGVTIHIADEKPKLFIAQELVKPVTHAMNTLIAPGP